jgi:hypothetical protein
MAEEDEVEESFEMSIVVCMADVSSTVELPIPSVVVDVMLTFRDEVKHC